MNQHNLRLYQKNNNIYIFSIVFDYVLSILFSLINNITVQNNMKAEQINDDLF